jgi:lantibiotic modifying enzyme
MSAVLQTTPGSQLINPWRPLLQGEAQERALATVQSIAQALSNPLQRALPADLPAEIHGAAAAASLSSGTAGLALFFAYLAQTPSDNGRDNDANHQAIHFLEQAMEGVATAPMGPALHGGFTGVGWTVAHLTDRLFALGDDDPNATFDDFLCTYVQRTPWPSDYDLIGGLVGIGVYALERLPNPSAVACLTNVIARLDELAEHNSQGITWRPPPALLPALQRRHCPNGYYNLGLAHGIPGIIAFLGCAYRAGIATAQTRRLLTGAVDWLLAQQITTADGPRFSSWVAPDYAPQVARHAWCYGEPGIAAALLSAAHSLQEPTWEAVALTIARRSATCPPDRAGVLDACLCHGAAGLGHLFNRIYQATGDATIGDAARFWLEATLNLHQPGQGIAGYLTYEPEEGSTNPWVAQSGFLTGAAGIGLALLAATTDIAPEWDRTLLLAIPPRDVLTPMRMK